MQKSCGLLTGLLVLSLSFARGEELEEFLKRIRSEDGKVRQAAWESAGSLGKEAVGPLALIAGGERGDAAVAASRALDRMAHGAAAPDGKSRKEIAGALAGLLGDDKMTEKVKIQALDLLSSIGEADAVPAIARTLQDAALRDWGRKALQRIPGPESAGALQAALAGASGEFLEDLIASLGHKRAAGAIPALTALTREGAETSRAAAATALARIADPASIPVVAEALRAITRARLRSALLDDYLQMGDALARAGNRQAAERIYSEALDSSRDPVARHAALYALAGENPGSRLEILLAASDDADAGLRRLAMELLISAKDEKVDGALSERYRKAADGRKAMLLRALASRRSPGVDGLIKEAAQDASAEVKVTALDLLGGLGDPSLEPLIAEAAGKGSPEVREIALKSYLALAGKQAASDPAAAARMYTRILETTEAPAFQGPALVGLAGTGDAGFPKRLEAARQAGKVAGGELGRATVIYYTSIGKAGRKDEAIARLLDLVGSRESREVIRQASASLKELGGDPTVFQKRQGLVATWHLFGPLPNKDGKGFDTVYSPEKGVNLAQQVDDRDRNRKWEAHQTNHESGVVDLETVFRRNQEVCAYAYAEIDSERDQDILFKLGSDDGVACWLNGEKIHSNNTIRAYTPDQDSVPGHLKAGINKVLLKITQGGGQWVFSLRVTDRQDKPIVLR